MRLFYLPATKAIIAKYNNKFVSLPNAIEIAKPEQLVPCQPFLKEFKDSKWNDMPDDTDAFYAHLNNYTLDKSDRRPRRIRVHKIELIVTYTTNEVGEPWFQLTGKLPHYVLNGIANVLKEEYYDSIK